MFKGFDFPESYHVNSKKEKLALSYAENFRKQFVHLYRDRKPLFLNPLNELQVEACYSFLLSSFSDLDVQGSSKNKLLYYCNNFVYCQSTFIFFGI